MLRIGPLASGNAGMWQMLLAANPLGKKGAGSSASEESGLQLGLGGGAGHPSSPGQQE